MISKSRLDEMSNNELWALHLEVNDLLTEKLTAQKDELERRLLALQVNDPDRRQKARPASARPLAILQGAQQ
jgi:hypothetical protein